MALNVEANGTLVEGPPEVCDYQLPAGVVTIPFFLNTGPTCPKTAQVSAGRQVTNVNSPSAFVELSMGSVTQAATVYVRVQNPGWQVKLTFNGGATATLPLAGMLLYEPDPASSLWVTEIQVQGTGFVEWYASGPA